MASSTDLQSGKQAGDVSKTGNPSYPTPNTPTVYISKEDIASDAAPQDDIDPGNSLNPSFHDPTLFVPAGPEQTLGANENLIPNDGIKHSGRAPVEMSFCKQANRDPGKALRECLELCKKRRSGSGGFTPINEKKSSAKVAGKVSSMPTAKKESPKPTEPPTTSHLAPMTTRGVKRRRDEEADSPENDNPDPSSSLPTSATKPSSLENAALKAKAPPVKRTKTMPPPASTSLLPHAVTGARKTAKAPKKQVKASKQQRTERKTSKSLPRPNGPQAAAAEIKVTLDTRLPAAYTDWVLPTGTRLKCSKAACANLFEDAWTPDLRTLDGNDVVDMYPELPFRRKAEEASTKLPRDHFIKLNDPCLPLVHPREAEAAAAIGSKSLHEYLTQKRRLFLGYAEFARQRQPEIRAAHAQVMGSCDVNKVSNMHRAFERWGWINSIPQQYVDRPLKMVER